MAISAIREADHFKINFPASARSAIAFLNRPEILKQFQTALESKTGQSCRFSVVLQEEANWTTLVKADAARKQSPQAHKAVQQPAVSSAGLLKETIKHPLVSHALTTFDAAIRKVDPPRRPADSHQTLAQTDKDNSKQDGVM
jgi:hypothetical protein